MTSVEAPEPRSTYAPWRFTTMSRSRVLSRLASDRMAVGSTLFLLALVAVAILAPVLAPYEPNAQELASQLRGPSREHLLGTDLLGRDILSRLLYGGRVSLLAAAQATLVAVGLGVPTGLIAGSRGRVVDVVLRTVADTVMSVPPLLLSIVIVGVLGPSLRNAMLSVGVVVAPRFFRIARGAALAVRHETYVEAARAVGCSTFRTIWRHILPNTSGPLLVQTSFVIGLAVVAEASLSFLGLGVQPPQASWGSMTQEGYQALTNSSWSIYPPAIIITLTVLAASILGDSIRDALGRERLAP